MKKLFNKLLLEFEAYAGLELDSDTERYLKKEFEQAFLEGQIKGLRERLKIK